MVLNSLNSPYLPPIQRLKDRGHIKKEPMWFRHHLLYS
jgi:hypothetical protein